ncbi:hypothetical protein GPJ56_008671 [Histomonas meleagridis]|uniref:uncharacterized protein n=1 Tax=Histomonas meleagridis TaxID=135588 RepID=UPI0035597A75|nr:hypothetical protein GPJ56_008671 [Histomonas meleagridis]KAH0805752.1 hypothetical protein GO595_001391 [Histomonas meleagridis]
MFKINFPDLPSTNDNVGAHLAQIAMNSSPMALVPRHNFELHFETEDIQENKSNVLNLLLSSLVPAVLPPNDPLQQPSKSDRKIPYHYLPPLIEECDCYMQYGFTERLLFELEGAGFDEFNFEKSSNPTQYEIDEISNELENRVKPQMEELRDELMKKLDKYRAIARKRNIENENFIYLKSTIKKRKRRSGRKS